MGAAALVSAEHKCEKTAWQRRISRTTSHRRATPSWPRSFARKRASDRKTAAKKQVRTGSMKPKPEAPKTFEPKAWPEDRKAHWFNALCVWIIEGGSLSSFCRQYPQAPSNSQWFEWLASDPIMADRYSRARENGADTLAEETVFIADEVKDAGHMDSARVNAARLRVDARKWVASKLKPKVYADRIETVTSGALTVNHAISDDERARALALILGRQVIATAVSLPDAQRRLTAPVIEHEPVKTSPETGPQKPRL
jgi:hypothetical protein